MPCVSRSWSISTRARTTVIHDRDRFVQPAEGFSWRGSCYSHRVAHAVIQPGQSNDIPPIVLLVDHEDDARGMYATTLQISGFWVATADDPDVAMNTATELRPNIIVASITFDGRTDGMRFIRAVKEDATTRDIPLVVLSGWPLDGLPRGAHEHAAMLLQKPVAPDELARRIHEVLATSHGLRERSTALTAKASHLREKSAALLRRAPYIKAPHDDRRRNCPQCASPLEWLERGTIGGIEYDYYRWCVKACGLYCYNRTDGEFLKLA
jgi:CheY-like chemotaxis protein